MTKLLNEIDEAEKADEDFDTRKLRQWSANLEENFETLKQLDSEIFDIMIDNDVDEADCQREANEVSEFREKVTYAKICLEDFLGQNEWSPSITKS